MNPFVVTRRSALPQSKDTMAFAVNPAIAASARLTTAQAFGTGASGTIINWDTVDYDPKNAITVGANWEFKAPVEGFYVVGGYIRTGPGSSVNSTEIRLYYSDAGAAFVHSLTIGRLINESAGIDGITFYGGKYLKLSDKVHLRCFTTVATAGPGSSTEAHVTITRVGGLT